VNEDSNNLIEIEDLHFAYGQQPGAQGHRPQRLPRGKVVASSASAAAGKSTLLRLIGGQLRPDRGSGRVAMAATCTQLDNKGLYAMRRDMGMMFQAGGLFSDLSVFENVAFPMRELTDLPEDLIRDLVLMKLHAVGLRGARERADAQRALRRHGAPRGAGARHRPRPDVDHV
jgi:phospholipid/cholesterol/gamma-HCH transport system ATP-binding protein